MSILKKRTSKKGLSASVVKVNIGHDHNRGNTVAEMVMDPLSALLDNRS